MRGLLLPSPVSLATAVLPGCPGLLLTEVLGASSRASRAVVKRRSRANNLGPCLRLNESQPQAISDRNGGTYRHNSCALDHGALG